MYYSRRVILHIGLHAAALPSRFAPASPPYAARRSHSAPALNIAAPGLPPPTQEGGLLTVSKMVGGVKKPFYEIQTARALRCEPGRIAWQRGAFLVATSDTSCIVDRRVTSSALS